MSRNFQGMEVIKEPSSHQKAACGKAQNAREPTELDSRARAPSFKSWLGHLAAM